MQAGKLPLDMLAGLLDKVEIKDPRVVLGPKPGEDAALLDFGDRYLVAKTDPITFATDLIGWYVVQVNANDLAVMGATPRWLMVTLLLPEGTEPDTVAGIFDQIRQACTDLNVTLVGGHTEITHDLPRPVAVGALLGEVDKDEVVFTSGVRPGDSIVLTKGIAIEGTAILAREAPDALAAAGVRAGVVERARDLLFSPGISVLQDASVARSAAKVHAMHDPTEGGVATGLLEMAVAANVGLSIDAERIPIVPECAEVCRALELDPLGLIASGSLLAAVSPDEAPRLIDALSKAGIQAAEIGHATEPDEGLKLTGPDGILDLPTFDRDELARYLGG
jgi:hydrogenase maturation factor